MMAIPEYLKLENVKPNLEADEMLNLCRRYNEVFGTSPMTEHHIQRENGLKSLKNALRSEKISGK